MKIKLSDKYVLTADAHNFILNRRWIGKKGKAKGKEILDAVGFYPTLPQALEGYTTMKLRQSSAQDIQTLLDELRSLTDHIKGLFKDKA